MYRHLSSDESLSPIVISMHCHHCFATISATPGLNYLVVLGMLNEYYVDARLNWASYGC